MVATWCVVRSEASREVDHACGAGADSVPIQPSGLCFLPSIAKTNSISFVYDCLICDAFDVNLLVMDPAIFQLLQET
ncbi:hypothetical protein R6Q57_028660 [Mikania cordata]